jgi:hypothetical protein
LKKRSIGEPGGIWKSSPPNCILLDWASSSTFTRTAKTAGFTFSTMSANVAGRIAVCACAPDGAN